MLQQLASIATTMEETLYSKKLKAIYIENLQDSVQIIKRAEQQRATEKNKVIQL